ncbi:MAG: DUF2971 domain-containing protein [Alcaligenaceae bacterium]|nr:DUF2971 domain-containing protein [Alcaligenaceae bacterium]
MSRFLYKYMPPRLDFFKDPMIRATPLTDLNDPFEGCFNEKQVRDADKNQVNYYRKNGKNAIDSDDSEVSDTIGIIQSELADLGILSFTEDCNNLLMWAHYADNHKGMVIEFDLNEPFFEDSIKELKGRRSRFGESHFADLFEFPERVSYRRIMPDFERPELSAPDSMNQFHWEKFNRAILFTKGDDWIYEKEQRSIVQLKDADAIICGDNEWIRRQCELDAKIKIETINEGKVKITYPNEYEMHEQMGDESIKYGIYRLSACTGLNPIHLFRINPKAISGVYFGCKSDSSEGLKFIRDNPNLKHLNNIYRMCASETEYQLVPHKVQNCMNSTAP